MNYESAREVLKDRLPDYIQSITKKSKSANMYVCPLCNSGTGHNKTGAFSLKPDKKHWKCFSCGEGGDIFDLIGKVENIPEPLNQLKRAAEIFNVSLDSSSVSPQPTSTNSTSTQSKPEKEPENYRDFYQKAFENLGKTDYCRGISKETLRNCGVGYIENYQEHNKTAHGWNCLIIPTSVNSYVIRNTDPNASKDNRYRKQGKTHLFNTSAIFEANTPIFIVEGEIDCMSILDCGGFAIGLGSTSNVNQLLNFIDQHKPIQPFIISLDNDSDPQTREKVEKAKQELKDGFTMRNITFWEANPYGTHKDANEALQADREAFTAALRDAENQKELKEKEEKEAYLQTSADFYLYSFINGIVDSINTPCLSTHFTKLDEILDGGLYEGLYILGGGTSMGKTAYVMQMADSIAKAGTDVLIFSLEMARSELISRSLSRGTMEQIHKSAGLIEEAKTARGISSGKRYSNYNDNEITLIKNSITDYKRYAKRIFISEGIGNIGVKEVREAVEGHIHVTGNKPLVIIDYLQILAPIDFRATDKQNMDRAVVELKRLSRDYKLSVIALSSFNRMNYNSDVAEAAFKESGAIEYSADVLLGLQFRNIKDKDFSKEVEEKKNPRELQLKIIKNRNGRKGDTIDYDYYPMFNYFIETDELPIDKKEDEPEGTPEIDWSRFDNFLSSLQADKPEEAPEPKQLDLDGFMLDLKMEAPFK